MAMYEYEWLCLTKCDYFWLYITMYYHVQSFVTMYDYIWVCMTMLTMYDNIWPFITLYDYVQGDLEWLQKSMRTFESSGKVEIVWKLLQKDEKVCKIALAPSHFFSLPLIQSHA